MTKVNISVPAELLDLINQEAAELGLTRSGLIQEAAVRYITQAQSDREAELRRLRMKAAKQRMREIGVELGVGGEDAVDVIAQARAQEERRHDR